MNTSLTPNTQAILLLTAPLISGRGTASPELLTPGEYKKIARHLHQMGCEPADLLSLRVADIIRDSASVVDAARIKSLLERGFALSQAIERWQSRAIWVVSRADPEYPQRLKERLKDDRPAVIYGCGDRSILDSGGLAVVGSREVDEALVEYTQDIGRLAARSRKTLVSGGARGIDQAAMRGALEAGGKVTGVLADSLEKTAMNRDHRSMLMEGQLVLVSPYDPSAGFNVGNAMQRNKLIYAFADAALVVNSDLNKGGTWAGAIEQLDKLKFVPVFVRSTGVLNKGIEGLQRKGALPWPNPVDGDGLDVVLRTEMPVAQPSIFEKQLFGVTPELPVTSPPASIEKVESEIEALAEPSPVVAVVAEVPTIEAAPENVNGVVCTPAEELYASVCRAVRAVLLVPKKEAEIADELQVMPKQLKEWLNRMVEEGVVEKVPKKTLFRLPGGLI
jgi:predicted Rossmann fold nucleotide-binding protein DprA/Smf involved in DNA uptake